ncbi:Metalloendopeptidase OMA1, mitochondrial [Orchesella cincta]|uniref:Metalloendopeptidase OMA1, mitochondrial n=1 Tax=Orchesella cincta TaxID=48709 RepID=A0A1D2MK08_ORCCI|nr:Metalloendopeptidase OMA1, mitochondrial [Orchesella cincta]
MYSIVLKNGSYVFHATRGMKSLSRIEKIFDLPKIKCNIPATLALTRRQVQIQPRFFFQTSSRKEALPAAAVSKFGAVLLGRTVRKYWRNLPEEKKIVWKKKLKRSKYIIAGILGAVGIGMGVYYQSHVQEAPVTHRKRFIAFTNDQIMESSKEALNSVLLLANEGQIIPATPETSELYDRIVKVSQQLIKGNADLPQVNDLEWTITVVFDNKNVNAYVLSCGSIFVYTGMLYMCDSDDQLGIILGHEMAHAVLGHSAEDMSMRNFWDFLFIIPLAALWAVLPNDLTAKIANWAASEMKRIIMDLPYSRFIEEEADQVGLILAAKACFDIREAPVVWAKMRLLAEDDDTILSGSQLTLHMKNVSTNWMSWFRKD